MQPIICKNSVRHLVEKIQESVSKGRIIGGLHVVDETDDQIVLLIDTKPITQEVADAWWSGYQEALK